jgi:nucleoside-diphosphate-sugar epimerase
MRIETETELEELLARPYAEDVEALGKLEGDLLILGVAGKMGPSLALRAARASREAGRPRRILGVSRFSNSEVRRRLEEGGVETIAFDLLDFDRLGELPEAENVVYMAARKFGSTGDEAMTWAMNTLLAARAAERWAASRIVAFSSGNVYPLVPVEGGGATEETAPGPIGEYAQSVLGRERLFEYVSRRRGTPVVLLRLNYAVELRYGVLVDIARKVWERRPVDVTMGHVNVIWQGDANSVALRSFSLCSSPPAVLNLTGPGTLAVRQIALEFGRRFGIEPEIIGREADTALLNNASRCHRLFGPPRVGLEEMLDGIAHWIRIGGPLFDKPTHFEVRNGKF